MKPRMAEEAFIIPADEPSGSGSVSPSSVDPLPSVSSNESGISATGSSAAESSVCLRFLLRFGMISLPENSTGTEISENVLTFVHHRDPNCSLTSAGTTCSEQALSLGTKNRLTTGENLIS